MALVVLAVAVATAALVVLTVALATAAALVIIAMIVAAGALVSAVLVAMIVAAAAIALIVVLVLGRVERPIQARGDGFGLLLIQQGDRLGAHATAADGVEHVVQGEGGVGAGQGELLLLGDREREAEVLEVAGSRAIAKSIARWDEKGNFRW